MIQNKHSLCILTCVEDAKRFLLEFAGEYNGWTLVSGHGSVNDYLETLGIDCIELSALVSDDFVRDAYKEADKKVKDILNSLDELYAQAISSILGIPKIRYFFPLFRYNGKFEYLNILRLVKIFQIIFEQNKFERVLIYKSVKTSFLDDVDLLAGVVQLLSKQYCFVLSSREGKN